MGDVEAAEEEKQRFIDAFAIVPETRIVYNNTCRNILAVAAEMLNGEIEYRKGNYEKAFAHLRQSVELDDNLLYSEPWAWMQPTRQALGLVPSCSNKGMSQSQKPNKSIAPIWG